MQPSILAILAAGPAHGYAITEKIADRYTFPAEPPRHSGIYRILRRMEKEGLLTSHLEEVSGGPARRVYGITAAGKDCLARWVESLTSYRQAIQSFLRLAARPR